MVNTTTGLDHNIAGLLFNILGWITRLVFILVEKENPFVRFHAMQSIIVFGALIIVSSALTPSPLIGWFMPPLIGLTGFILWILLMVEAYQGKLNKLPNAGDWAEKWVG